jgi:hypothetical protein
MLERLNQPKLNPRDEQAQSGGCFLNFVRLERKACWPESGAVELASPLVRNDA